MSHMTQEQNSLAYAYYEFKHTVIGANVRKWRKLQNMKQTSVANEAGISRTYLCDIEQGRVTPSPSVLVRIAFVLDCTPNDLFYTGT